jgi:hypothetical protein
MRADLVVIDERLTLYAAMVGGRRLFEDRLGVPADVEVIDRA